MGYDLSCIRCTAVGPWYARLGCETVVKWTGRGIMNGQLKMDSG